MQIYLARNQVQAGPYTLDQLNTMLATQEVELTDLMWHEGMTKWVRVGDMTNETHHYNPNDTHIKAKSRTTVDELYGNKKGGLSHKHAFDVKSIGQVVGLNKKSAHLVGKNELATVGNRILAVLIDQVLAWLCLVPLLSAINFDFKQLEGVMQDPAILETLIASVPMHLVLMTLLMFIALVAIQISMLLRRGQSIGKLAVGVRILDNSSHRVPSTFNLLFLRTILTNLAYSLPTIGQIILILDVVFMLRDKQRRSLHDKIAKTYVVKAHDSQLTPDTQKTKTKILK